MRLFNFVSWKLHVRIETVELVRTGALLARETTDALAKYATMLSYLEHLV